MAGVTIGIAGFGYLAIGGLAGAVLFSFGLLTVVGYKLKLYTGTAGFINKGEVLDLLVILLGNIIGCLLVGLLTRASNMDLQTAAQKILESASLHHLRLYPLCCGCLLLPFCSGCIPESSLA